MDFHESRTVKATRKECHCDWCYEDINKGNPSVSTRGKGIDGFYSGRYHPECYDATQRWFTKYGYGEDYLPEEAMIRGGIEPKNN